MHYSIITFWDWLLAPLYVLVILVAATIIKKTKVAKNPIYKYFVWGLFIKIIGSIALCLIYVYYYTSGGDTLNYNSDSSILLKFFLNSPVDFLDVWLSPTSPESMSKIPSDLGVLVYHRDPNAFMVVRLLFPLKLLAFDCYLVASILMAVVSFSGVWKLYRVFCDYYPSLYKHFAFTILFVPSVVFWGSGLLKDSWTLSAVGWYTYSFYKIFIKKETRIASSITLLISAFILISIKPYIFIALLPGTFLWMISSRINNIKSVFIRILIAPLIIFFGLGLGFLIFSFTSSSLGQYSSIDSMLQKAVDSSYDLKQDYYQGNSFDIGSFDPTLSGLLSMFPIATMTGLFRPFFLGSKKCGYVYSRIGKPCVFIIFSQYFN